AAGNGVKPPSAALQRDKNRPARPGRELSPPSGAERAASTPISHSRGTGDSHGRLGGGFPALEISLRYHLLITFCEARASVICVGLNYADHCAEQGAKLPAEPIIFSKFPSAIAGPFDDILHPAESSEVDWEVELAFVIGRKGKHIAEEAALEHVAGFAVANDVSARDWQRRNGRQWLLSKTFDTFCPLGPALVTKDAVTDVNNLSIRCSVNGHPVQSSNTSQLIFKVPQLVAWVSRYGRWTRRAGGGSIPALDAV
uniref:Fumarylacetoacetase-like C-terminal domain-containing protein n=1 Tax=Dromaius novaehollandiae TaxID=8790 RepID=A0A8C4J9T8_DRONO